MFITHDAMQCNLQSDWSLLNISQNTDTRRFEGIKEDGTWLYEKLPTFNTWAIIPTWFFATYLLKQYTNHQPQRPGVTQKQFLIMIRRLLSKSLVKILFIYLFIFCCLVREII